LLTILTRQHTDSPVFPAIWHRPAAIRRRPEPICSACARRPAAPARRATRSRNSAQLVRRSP